jgi:transcriptional regulator with XRE-family HTH domain
MAKRGPDPRDAEVGRRVHALRLEREMSQEKLSDRLDLTVQPVQKYEKGTNSVRAGRLQRISKIFEAPQNEPATLFKFLATATALRLLRAHSRIPRAQTKQALVRLVETISGAE